MTKIKSLADLQKIKDELQSQFRKNENANPAEQVIEIKVGMSTCGVASGAKEIMKIIREECDYQAIDVVLKQTGCLGYCYAEPMVEVKMPGKMSKVFGFVNKNRANEIVNKFILHGEEIGGEIKVSFEDIYQF